MRWLAIGMLLLAGSCLAGCTGTLNIADTKYHVESVPPGIFSADLNVNGLDAEWSLDPLLGIGKAIGGIKDMLAKPDEPDGDGE